MVETEKVEYILEYNQEPRNMCVTKKSRGSPEAEKVKTQNSNRHLGLTGRSS